MQLFGRSTVCPGGLHKSRAQQSRRWDVTPRANLGGGSCTPAFPDIFGGTGLGKCSKGAGKGKKSHQDQPSCRHSLPKSNLLGLGSSQLSQFVKDLMGKSDLAGAEGFGCIP